MVSIADAMRVRSKRVSESRIRHHRGGRDEDAASTQLRRELLQPAPEMIELLLVLNTLANYDIVYDIAR